MVGVERVTTLAPRRIEQGDGEFEANLGYIASSKLVCSTGKKFLKTNKQTNIT